MKECSGINNCLKNRELFPEEEAFYKDIENKVDLCSICLNMSILLHEAALTWLFPEEVENE